MSKVRMALRNHCRGRDGFGQRFGEGSCGTTSMDLDEIYPVIAENGGTILVRLLIEDDASSARN
jgi:hypothetical protein